MQRSQKDQKSQTGSLIHFSNIYPTLSSALATQQPFKCPS